MTGTPFASPPGASQTVHHDWSREMSATFRRYALPVALVSAMLASAGEATAQETPPREIDYLLLASNRTSTMEREMREAAESGYAFAGIMGGETAFGGSEVVVVMQRVPGSTPRFTYRLLATNKTSTMQQELQQAGEAGFSYRGQTVFETTFGGKEAVVILERDNDQVNVERVEYLLLATTKTSTMQKELREAGARGFQYVGVTVADTAFGGKEIVAILRRPAPEDVSYDRP